MNKQDIINLLNLEPHIEGGYFRETYRDETTMMTERDGGDRPLLTSIYYLLTDDRPIDYFHQNRSPIMHYFHSGSAITYHLITPAGEWQTIKLGLNITAGEVPQLLVPSGHWKTAILEEGEYGLLGESVAPGFDYRDMKVATLNELTQLYPQHQKRLVSYIHPEKT
ncbi:cupin domain-containing protein [[Limnothrix rosea] IAM M-220]|uniref:cupin domain-containing protein n=1 Tax=[Limnothrix rosea] IAM M-220 TaxID=454133 RepID=UPI0009649ED0|nr:cupin domain-containing protein [[Limnothrix rosea] IAM M-220]OKH18919.1 cupin [[Limnothrix rosea] IAM M-220]